MRQLAGTERERQQGASRGENRRWDPHSQLVRLFRNRCCSILARPTEGLPTARRFCSLLSRDNSNKSNMSNEIKETLNRQHADRTGKPWKTEKANNNNRRAHIHAYTWYKHTCTHNTHMRTRSLAHTRRYTPT